MPKRRQKSTPVRAEQDAATATPPSGYDTERVLRDFAAVTSQQLVALVSAALGELDHATATKDQSARYQALVVAHRAAEQALGLGRNLRYYATQTTLRIESIDFSQVVLDTIDMVEKEFLSMGIRINCFAEAATYLVADGAAIRQITLNLLYNARESLPKGGRVTVSVKHDPNGVSLRITDDGARVPTAELEDAFEPHFNPQEGNRRVLGLAVAKVLVEAMGGRIAVESSGNAGNTLTFHLPHLHPPTKAGYDQRRRFRRVKLDLPAEINLGGVRHAGRLKVLGRGGCFLELTSDIDMNPHRLERECAVRIWHFERESIEIPRCRIVDSHRIENHRAIGLAFEEVGEKAARIIRALVQGHTD